MCLRSETKLTNEMILRQRTPLLAKLAESSSLANHQDHLGLAPCRVHRRDSKGSGTSNVRVHNRLSGHIPACDRCTLFRVARPGPWRQPFATPRLEEPELHLWLVARAPLRREARPLSQNQPWMLDPSVLAGPFVLALLASAQAEAKRQLRHLRLSASLLPCSWLVLLSSYRPSR